MREAADWLMLTIDLVCLGPNMLICALACLTECLWVGHWNTGICLPLKGQIGRANTEAQLIWFDKVIGSDIFNELNISQELYFGTKIKARLLRII